MKQNVIDYLNDLLNFYKIDSNLSAEIKEGYRHPLESVIGEVFENKPHFRYGGSIAKGTANSNSCDMDLLCYYDSDVNITVENIYNEIAKKLEKENFYIKRKNSAIFVNGRAGDDKWEFDVDVVPGKYTSNEDNKDVYLWCNKDKCRLKSNPEIQIEKVKQCDSKDVIRLIKLYRTNRNFKFKSFYLEIFIIDIVEKEYNKNDDIYDKLIKFCKHYNDIGNVVLFDPANSNNNIKDIHEEFEFATIRKEIKRLYDALMTLDLETIKNCIEGKEINIDEGYYKNAKGHSSISKCNNSWLQLNGFEIRNNGDFLFNSNSILQNSTKLRFEIFLPPQLKNNLSDLKLIVCNAGYDAFINNCLRGNAEVLSKKDNDTYEREESTAYYGNHFVQAVLRTKNGTKIFSNLLVVRVRF